MSNSNNVYFRAYKHEGIERITCEGKDVDSICIKVSNAVGNPIQILYQKTNININEIYNVHFEHLDYEVMFLQDLYFALEEVNSLSGTQRITDGTKITSFEDIMKQVQGEMNG